MVFTYYYTRFDDLISEEENLLSSSPSSPEVKNKLKLFRQIIVFKVFRSSLHFKK